MNDPSMRLAPFLRESCAQNLYGLSYLDQEQTILRIPWPVVPKQSRGVPPGFEIFHDWAVMSKQKRNKLTDPAEQNEPPTQQKHRFRNALNKANGIRYREDIKIVGARVYQFIGNNKSFSRSQLNNTPSPTEFDQLTNRADYSNNVFTTSDCGASVCPSSVYSQEIPNLSGSPTYPIVQTPSDTQDITNEKEMEEILNLFDSVQPQQEQVIDMGMGDSEMAAPAPPQPTEEFQSWSLNSQPWSLTDLLQLAPEDPNALEVKVCYRQEDASRCYVTNRGGCRLYFGKNIPDLSQLLEKEHMEHIMKMFRYEKDYYFGPESWQQIELPQPNDFMRSSLQKEKTQAILQNMERGLLLYIDRSSQSTQLNVPDVFAMRLCQTRVFPCHENASCEDGLNQTSDTLERMKWTKVFDGKKFCEEFMKVGQVPNAEYPSPSFSLSLGQRPSSEKRSLLFVCLTVTVQAAQQLIQNRLDSDIVCISYVNSTDMEARKLATKLTESLTLQQCEKVY